MIIKYSLQIIILASLATVCSAIAEQTVNKSHESSAVFDNYGKKKVISPKQPEPVNSIPVAIPGKKGESADIRVLSKHKNANADPLITAVQSGDISAVTKALQSTNTNIHARDNLDRTSLMLAAQKGYPEIIDILLAAGVDPNAKDQQNQTALTYAAMSGHEKVIKLLISSQANIEAVDNDGRTPLIWAIISKNLTAVSLLVTAGADVNRSDLKGVSPLIYSFGMENPDITRLLIENGADIDVLLKKSNMDTLALAARMGDTTIIKALISKGRDVNAKTTAGVTPLMKAVSNNHKAAAKLLIDSGARVNDKNKVGRSAIFYSTNRNVDSDIAEMLIANGAKLDEISNSGFTPLSQAAANGNTAVIKILINAGLSASGQSTKGEFTPLMSAAANNQPAAIEKIFTYKPDIDSRGPRGMTALMYAAQYNCLKCVELLLTNGANAKLVDERNKSALDYAKQNKKAKKIVEILETNQSVN